jgi:hypothetical protein
VVCRGARTDGVSDFCYDAVPLAAPISVKILHGAEAQAGCRALVVVALGSR